MLVGDSKIRVITYNVAPLDTQAGNSQGNTGRETVSGAVIISHLFSLMTGTEAQ